MKTFRCNYTAYNRDFKEYQGEFWLKAETEEEAYQKAHKDVLIKWGSDLLVNLTLTQRESEESLYAKPVSEDR